MYNFSSFKKVAGKAGLLATAAYGAAALYLTPVLANSFGLNQTDGGTAGKLNITKNSDLLTSVQDILNSIFMVLGIVAVVIIIWEGITVITSKDNEEKLKKAQKYLINAAIGFAMILLSGLIVNFIINIANTSDKTSAQNFQTTQGKQ